MNLPDSNNCKLLRPAMGDRIRVYGMILDLEDLGVLNGEKATVVSLGPDSNGHIKVMVKDCDYERYGFVHVKQCRFSKKPRRWTLRGQHNTMGILTSVQKEYEIISTGPQLKHGETVEVVEVRKKC